MHSGDDAAAGGRRRRRRQYIRNKAMKAIGAEDDDSFTRLLPRKRLVPPTSGLGDLGGLESELAEGRADHGGEGDLGGDV